MTYRAPIRDLAFTLESVAGMADRDLSPRVIAPNPGAGSVTHTRRRLAIDGIEGIERQIYYMIVA